MMDSIQAPFTHLEFHYVVRVIYSNDNAYGFLVRYFLDKLSDPYFERELKQAKNQRWFICENMASWIPYDEYSEKILQKIKEFAAA